MTKFAWSASSLQQALECLYEYYLERKLKVKVPLPAPMAFGGNIHRIIEIAHKGPRGKFHPTSKRPLYFNTAAGIAGYWKSYWHLRAGPKSKDQIAWRDTEQFWQFMVLGAVMLGGGQTIYQGKQITHKGYFQSILNPPLSVPITKLRIEERFDVKFWGFPVTGRYDQIWELSDGRVALVDITTGWPKDVKRLQFTLYAKAFLEQNGKLPDMLFLWHLRTNVLIPTTRSMGDLQHLRLQLEHTAASIQDGRFVETQVDVVCRRCRYRNICDRTRVGKEVGFDEELDEVPAWVSTEQVDAKKPRSKQTFFKGGWFQGKIAKGEG